MQTGKYISKLSEVVMIYHIPMLELHRMSILQSIGPRIIEGAVVDSPDNQ